MTRTRHPQLLYTLLIVAVLSISCGSQPKTQAPVIVVPSATYTLIPTIIPTNTLPTPTAAVPTDTPSPTPLFPGQFPIGIFTKDDADGHWLINFKADGTFTTRVNGQFIARSGMYTLQDDQVVLSDDSSVCQGRGDGVYQWVVDENQVMFILMSDECNRRRVTMDESVWTPVP